MNPTGYTLVLLGALCIGTFNIVKKAEFNTHQAFWKNRALLFTGLVNGVAALALFAIAALTGGIEGRGNWLSAMLATALLNIVIQLANTKSVLLEDVSLVGPIAATTPATIILASMLILGEYPTALGWLGVWTVVIGTYILNIQDYLDKKRAAGKSSWRDWLAPFCTLGRSRGVRWAFASVLIASVSLNFDAMAYRQANVAFAGGCIFGIVGLANLVAARKRGEFAEPKPNSGFSARNLAIIILLHIGAIWLSSAALRYGIAPYVGTLKRLQIPMVIVLAYFFLGEKKDFKTRLLGGTIMAIGAILIALA